MAELLAVRSCTYFLVLRYTRSLHPHSGGCRRRSATALGLYKDLQSQQLCIWQNKKSWRVADKGSSGVRAGLEDANGKNEPYFMSSTSEDWQYAGKLLGACAAGAVLIKYGSILLPIITQPNLQQALIMITTPMLVSVAVLLAASSERKLDE